MRASPAAPTIAPTAASSAAPGGRATISDGTAATPAAGADEAPQTAAAARPFLKWAGGKTQILDQLVARAPARIDTYYEPFLGGGALFFRLASDPERRPREAVLNDLNHELIAAFRAVRDDAQALIERLGELERAYLDLDGDERGECYYAVRQEYRELVAAAGADDIEVASRLIFLNKTCFNGLYRVNRSGEFNVPHGRYARPRILDGPALEAASAALAGVELRSVDFEVACEGAGPDDFVYFDPSYWKKGACCAVACWARAGVVLRLAPVILIEPTTPPTTFKCQRLGLCARCVATGSTHRNDVGGSDMSPLAPDRSRSPSSPGGRGSTVRC